MTGFSSLNRNIERLGDTLLTVAGAVCLILPVVLLVVVVVRAIVPAGIPMWSLDACELLMWFPAYLALGYTWRTGHHVRVTVFTSRIRGKKGLVIDFVILTVAFAMTLVLVWAGLKASVDAWVEAKRTYSELPEYYFSVAIPVGIIYLAYEVAASMRRTFKTLQGKKV